jgi:ParB family chromosome partitioning protein
MTQTKPAPLGRGLSALFGDADTSYQTKSAAPPGTEKRGMQQVPIGNIRPGTFQPRRRFDDKAMAELADSVRANGVLQPLLVRPVKNAEGQYELIAGERRWRAAQLAKLHDVPVVVREISDREALEHGIIENVQREDLSPLEEAEGYKRLIDEFRHSQDDLARIVGKSRAYIGSLVRLLGLPPEVLQMIDRGELSAGHARALVTAKNPLLIAREIVRLGLSVRQTEELARVESDVPHVLRKKVSRDANIIGLEKDLERATGLKVSVAAQGARGAVTLRYQSLDQLDLIIRKLKA